MGSLEEFPKRLEIHLHGKPPMYFLYNNMWRYKGQTIDTPGEQFQLYLLDGGKWLYLSSPGGRIHNPSVLEVYDTFEDFAVSYGWSAMVYDFGRQTSELSKLAGPWSGERISKRG